MKNMTYKKGGARRNQDAVNMEKIAELRDLGNKRTEPVQMVRPNATVNSKTAAKMRKPVK
jgi:hypothetical protein